MISKIIPAESRGTFFGTQAAIAEFYSLAPQPWEPGIF